MIVYFTRPDEVLSRALADFCPAITVESGQARDPFGVDHVLDFLEQCLALDTIPATMNKPEEPRVYHSIARIEVPENCRIGFGEDSLEYGFQFYWKSGINEFRGTGREHFGGLAT